MSEKGEPADVGGGGGKEGGVGEYVCGYSDRRCLLLTIQDAESASARHCAVSGFWGQTTQHESKLYSTFKMTGPFSNLSMSPNRTSKLIAAYS